MRWKKLPRDGTDLIPVIGKKWVSADNGWFEEAHPVNRGGSAALLLSQPGIDPKMGV
jgi:hypothetical protein